MPGAYWVLIAGGGESCLIFDFGFDGIRKDPRKTMKMTPAAQYLRLIRKSLAGIRRDIPALAKLGEAMAQPVLAGGDLVPSPVSAFWPSEFSGRAGGLMGIRWHGFVPAKKTDVAYFALPDRRRWDPERDEHLSRLVKSPGRLFVIGRPEDVAPLARRRFAGFTGGAAPEAGLYGVGETRPLAPLRPLEQIVRGWSAAGEFVAACTRAGRMPILWMSVWLEGALVRNASFTRLNNLREPFPVPMFHEDRYIPPLAAGRVAGEFVGFVEGMLESLESQTGALARAGRWLAEAKRAGRRVWTVAVGHSYPEILDRPPGYPLEWGHSVSDLAKAVPADLGPGDVALHLGYSPVNVADVKRICGRGIKFIYMSPYGRPATLGDHRNLLWLDLEWRPGDACVDVPGYGARLIPSSSSAHTMAYFAILSEMAERMGWR